MGAVLHVATVVHEAPYVHSEIIIVHIIKVRQAEGVAEFVAHHPDAVRNGFSHANAVIGVFLATVLAAASRGGKEQ